MACDIRFGGLKISKDDFQSLYSNIAQSDAFRNAVMFDNWSRILTDSTQAGRRSLDEKITDVKDAFDYTGTDAEFLDLMNREDLRRRALGKKPNLKERFDATLSDISDFVKDSKNKITNLLTKEGALRKVPEVYESLIKRNGKIQKENEVAIRNLDKLSKAIKSEKLSPLHKLQVSQILNGEDPSSTTIPSRSLNKLLPLINTARNQINRLSGEIRSIPGLLNQAQIDVFLDREGRYTTRIYEAHRNPEWVSEVQGTDIWTNAVPQIRAGLDRRRNVLTKWRSRINNKLKNSKENPNSPSNKKRTERIAKLDAEIANLNTHLSSPDKLNQYMTQMLTRLSGKVQPTVNAGNNKGAADRSIIRQRGEITPEIRALLGEIRDPAELVIGSVSKMAANIANNMFQVAFADVIAGKNRSSLISLTPDASKGFTERVSLDDSRYSTIQSITGLTEIFTHPDIAAELRGDRPTTGGFMGALSGINAFVKVGLTVYSPTTQVRNFVGNIPFLTMNGYVASPEFPRVMSELIGEVGTRVNAKKDTQTRKDLIDKLIELQVVNSSIDIREINEHFKRNKTLTALASKIDSSENRLLKGLSKTHKFAAALYGASDDLFKLVGFKMEAERASDALFNKPYDQLTTEESATVDEYAANIVRNTFPNYNETYRFVQKLRSYAAIAPFASFAGEVVRTTIERAKLTGIELRSTNPKIRAIGAKRLAGQGLFTIFTAIAPALFSQGVDEEERDVWQKWLAPPWVKDGILIKREGYYEYTNPSAVNPIAVLSDTVAATQREGILSGIKVFTDSFTALEPGVNTLLELFNNQNAFDKPIYNPSDSPGRIGKDVATHLIKGPVPGVARTFIRGKQAWDRIEVAEEKLARAIRSNKPEKEIKKLQKSLRLAKEKYQNEKVSAFGLRISTSDPESSASFRIKEFLETRSNNISSYRTRRGNSLDPEDLGKIYSEIQSSHKKNLNEAKEMYTEIRDVLGFDLEEQFIAGFAGIGGKFTKADREYIFGNTKEVPELIIKQYYTDINEPVPTPSKKSTRGKRGDSGRRKVGRRKRDS